MEQKKLSKSRQKKEQIVAKLSDKVSKAKGLVFTNYQGLTHKQLEDLKKKLRTANAQLLVTKNTLLKLALGKVSKIPIDTFKNATATLFLFGDPIEPLRQLAKTIKEFNLSASPAGGQGGPTIKFGILDGQALTSDQVLKLSTLPSRETLLTQLVFGLKSPISGLHRALTWNLQKFVMTLKAIGRTKN